MSKVVVLINGRPRAGKDTAVQFMQESLDRARVMSESYSSIQPVKNMLSSWVDLRKKTEADRRLMSIVGDALQEHSQFRTNTSLAQIGKFFEIVRSGVFFLHMREPALIEKVKKGCEKDSLTFIRLLVESPRSENVTNNHADADVEKGEYDYRMQNAGTLDDLRANCDAFLRFYGLLRHANQLSVD